MTRRLAVAILLLGGVPVGVATAAPVEKVEQCFGADPTILGTRGDDRLRGTRGDDVIAGFGGDDVLIGSAGNDILCGGAGDDELRGGPGDDGIVTDRGRDRADGGPGSDVLTEVTESSSGMLLLRTQMRDQSRDVLRGGGGDDLLGPEGGDDIVEGGPGRDVAGFLWLGDPVLVDLEEGFASSGNGGIDELRSVEGAWGGVYADALFGTGSTNWFFGFGGPDHIDARGGSDVLWALIDGAQLIGGNDQAADTVAVALSEPAIVDLAGGTAGSLLVSHGHPHDVLVGIENAVGTDHDDVIVGDSLDNALFGRAGDDWAHGGAGDDLLRGDGPVYLPSFGTWNSAGGADSLDGGPGTDHLDGGPKKDSCVNGETVTSCESEGGRIDGSTRVGGDIEVTWFGTGPTPWWWLRVGEFALHPHEGI